MKRVNKICPVCSKEFTVPHCHQSRYKSCSRECGHILKRKPRIENVCKLCSKIFISKKTPSQTQTFCSRQCSAKQKKNGIHIKCKECSEIFYITPHRCKETKTRGKFCSNKCRLINWNRSSMIKQKPGMYRVNAWRTYEEKCHDCGNKDKRVLIIHHIDGNRKNGKIENLIPVCHNCHCLRHLEMGGKRVPSAYK